MPIVIAPTETTKPATETFVADKLFVDGITIESDKLSGDAAVSITNTPYADTDDGKVFASVTETLKTASAFGLSAIVPEVGAAIAAIYRANAAWRVRHKANVATLAIEQGTAVGRLAIAEAAVASAEAAYVQAGMARDAAWTAKQQASALGADDPDKPAAVAATAAAFTNADNAWKAKLDTLNDAKANVAAVAAANAARLTIAEAAVADAANPPLTA